MKLEKAVAKYRAMLESFFWNWKVSLQLVLSKLIEIFPTSVVLFNFGPNYRTSFFPITFRTFQILVFTTALSNCMYPNNTIKNLET